MPIFGGIAEGFGDIFGFGRKLVLGDEFAINPLTEINQRGHP